MSFITDLRAYVDTRIKAVDVNLVAEDTQVFGNDNPGKHLANKRYNLILSPLEGDRDDTSHIERLPFQIDIYEKAKGKGKVTDAFDALYDKARGIRDEIIHRYNIVNLTDFFDIEFINITPTEELDNDRAFRMRLEFIVTRKYCIS